MNIATAVAGEQNIFYLVSAIGKLSIPCYDVSFEQIF